MERSKVFDIVKGYILNQLTVSEDKIVDSARVVEDLGGDSANLMMLVMDLEAEFNTTMEDDAIISIKTVGDIVDYIVKKV